VFDEMCVVGREEEAREGECRGRRNIFTCLANWDSHMHEELACHMSKCSTFVAIFSLR
jgi:hypothetical protein